MAHFDDSRNVSADKGPVLDNDDLSDLFETSDHQENSPVETNSSEDDFTALSGNEENGDFAEPDDILDLDDSMEEDLIDLSDGADEDIFWDDEVLDLEEALDEEVLDLSSEVDSREDRDVKVYSTVEDVIQDNSGVPVESEKKDEEKWVKPVPDEDVLNLNFDSRSDEQIDSIAGDVPFSQENLENAVENALNSVLLKKLEPMLNDVIGKQLENRLEELKHILLEKKTD